MQGSPFKINVTPSDVDSCKPKSGGELPGVGDKCAVNFDIPNVKLPNELKDLKAMLEKPTGKKEPLDCKSTPDNLLGLEFIPTEAGKHLIHITKNGCPVKGSIRMRCWGTYRPDLFFGRKSFAALFNFCTIFLMDLLVYSTNLAETVVLRQN